MSHHHPHTAEQHDDPRPGGAADRLHDSSPGPRPDPAEGAQDPHHDAHGRAAAPSGSLSLRRGLISDRASPSHQSGRSRWRGEFGDL